MPAAKDRAPRLGRKKSLPPSPMARLRAYFLAGILITAPVGLTLYIAWNLIAWVDNMVLSLVPAQYNPETYLPFFIPGLGLIVVLVALTLIGALTAGLVGKWVRQSFDLILTRLPVVRSIYGAIKQIVETMLTNQSRAFRECVLVEFPRPGVWSLGFVSGATPPEIAQRLDDDVINIFVPTTPNPTGGYLLFVPRAKVIFLKMAVEDGVKLVVSTGIVQPESAPAS
jgi:uncharacterized membrane protein